MLKSIKEYSPNTTEDFRSEPCHEPIAQTGSHIQPITLLDDDSESEDESDDEEGNIQNDDINSLLVKSWETKVFPIIRFFVWITSRNRWMNSMDILIWVIGFDSK